MRRLVLPSRTPLALALVIMYASTYPAAGPDPATVEQAAATHVRVADDPEVLGAERLFSAWMEGQIAYRSLPGVVVGVVSDQQLVWAKGFGFADITAKVAMTPTTKFRMASHSKLFTAIAIMQLREAGKLHLDDPVANYLTWFKARPAGDDDGPITIEQLLSHSSGLSVKRETTGRRSSSRPLTSSGGSTPIDRRRLRRRSGGSTPTSPTRSRG